MNMLCSVDNLLGTTIAPQMPVLKMMFFFQRWDMLVPWVSLVSIRFQRGGDPNIKVPKEEVALWSKLKGHIQTGCFYGICCLPFNEGHVLGHGLTSWVGIRGSSSEDTWDTLGCFKQFLQTKLYQNICWFQWCYLATAHFVGRVIAIHTYLINSVVEKR